VAEDPLSRTRVLAVDNEAGFVDLTASMLEREDDQFEVTGVRSGADALDVLEREAIDCIVSDYDMPTMNGLELLEAVRSRDPELPFILFTGKGSEEIASEAIAAGVTQYLQKQPGSDQFTLLANQISNAVSQYRAETELRESKRRYEQTLATLHETTRDLMRAGTKTEMYRAAVGTAQSILEVPIVAAYQFEPTKGALVHVVSTPETRQAVSSSSTIERGDGLLWEAFSAGEPRYRTGPETATSAVQHALEMGGGSELIVPLGTHGILVAGTDRGEGFDESMRELLNILGANTEAALDRAEREQLLREHDRTLTEQNEALTRLNHTNEIVRAINRGIAQATTRRAIEEHVCTQLAETDRYLGAWTTAHDRNGPTPEVWDGIDATYIDQLRDEGTAAPEWGLIERALETESVQVVDNVLDEPGWDERRRAALTYGYQTVVAVPLLDGDRTYGAFVIHAPQASALSESEREVLGELGETIGHAIRSVERTRAMVTDSRLEIELESASPRLLLNRLEGVLGRTLSLEGLIDRTEEAVLFVSVADGEFDVPSLQQETESWATIESLSLVSEGEQATLLELTVVPTPFIRTLREFDAHVSAATSKGGSTSLVLSVPGQIDTRALVESVQENYSDTELTARRETGVRTTNGRLDTQLEEHLTAKQLEALQVAHYSGFFAWPRESTGEELATTLDISPPTYHYHLRAAQRKLVGMALDRHTN